MSNKKFAYGEDAIEWLDLALRDMKQRTGWEFEPDMIEFLESFVSEGGIPVGSAQDLSLFVDDFYVNRERGRAGEGRTADELSEAYASVDILHYNAETGLYVI